MSQDQNEHDPLLGTVFADRYQLQSRLGKGGMAIVYKAADRNLGREVAIKVLRKDVAGDPIAAKRLIREARAAASLHHPNIITVHDVGESNGTVYVVMEILVGKPLADVLEEEGSIGIERALGITEQLCAALAVAHTQGIVHRDIKPENLFLIDHASGDFVKVLDFSIAKLPTEMVTAALTRAGSVFGTPHYMAPEQVEGKSVGPHADLYAVGAVLYELITGEPPFDGPSVIDILLKHVKAPPPTLAAHGIKAPAGVDLLITKLLAKKATDRPASASAVRDEIAKLMEELRHESEAAADGRPPSVPKPLPPAEPAVPLKPPISFRPPSAMVAPVAVPAQPAVPAQAPTGPTEARPIYPPAAAIPTVGKRVFQSFGNDIDDKTLATDMVRGPLAEAKGPEPKDAEHKTTVREFGDAGDSLTAGIPSDLPSDLPVAPPRLDQGRAKHAGFGESDPAEGRTLVGAGVGKAVADLAAKRAAAAVPPSPIAYVPPMPIVQVATVPEVAPLRPRAAPAALEPLDHEHGVTATEPVQPVPSRPAVPRPPAGQPPTASSHTRRPPARYAQADDRAPTQQGLGMEAVPPPPERAPSLHAASTQAATVIAQVPVAPRALDQGKTIKILWVVAGVSGAVAIALALWMALH